MVSEGREVRVCSPRVAAGTGPESMAGSGAGTARLLGVWGAGEAGGRATAYPGRTQGQGVACGQLSQVTEP